MKLNLLLLIAFFTNIVGAQTVFKPTSLVIGKGTDVDMTYVVDRAGSSDPKLKWDGTTFKWYFSNDGTTFGEMVDKAYVDAAVAAATIPDATSLVKGKIQLAGDLGGTAALPTVPGLTLKADLASPALTGTPTAPTATGGTNTTQLATTAFVTSAVAGATPADATTLVKGILQLAGDLGGTAALPTVPGLALKAPLASPTFTGVPAAPTAAAATNTTQIATTAFVTTAVSNATDPTKISGPASSTDTAVVVFDGTTGKLAKNSLVTVDTAGQVTTPEQFTATNTAKTSTLHGMQFNNNQITATGGANLTLSTATTSEGIQLQRNTVFNRKKLHAETTDAATGANATLTAPTASYVRLTSATLTSIDMIPAGLGNDELTLSNSTGVTVYLNHNTGGTAANRIYTNTGTPYKLTSTGAVQLYYNQTLSRWVVKGPNPTDSTSQFNQLTNPGFEDSSTANGWTSSCTGTAALTATSTTPKFGLKAVNIQITGGASGGTCTFYQDVTTTSALDAREAIFAKTSATNTVVWSRRNGSNVFSLPMLSANTWNYYPFQMTMGTTSTGIAVVTTAAASSTTDVALDEAYVGFEFPSVEVDINTAWQTCTSAWTTSGTAPSLGNGSLSCEYRRLGDTAETKITLQAGSTTTFGTGDFRFALPNSLTTSQFGVHGFSRLSDDGTASNRQSATVQRGGSNFWIVAGLGDYISSTIPFTWAQNDSVTLHTFTKIDGWSTSTDAISWKNKTFTSAASYTPTGSWTTNATYSGKWWRVADRIHLNINVELSGANSQGDLTLTSAQLLNGIVDPATGAALSVDTNKLTLGTVAGTEVSVGTGVLRDAGLASYAAITAWWNKSSSRVELGGAAGANFSNISSPGTPITFASGDNVNMLISLPIVGWEATDLAQIDISGLQQCADSYQCTNDYAFTSNSSGVPVNETLDWINGAGVPSSNRFTYTFKSGLFTTTPSCTCTMGPFGGATSDYTCSISTVSNTSLTINMTNNGSGTTESHSVRCSKQSADFTATTAKAVASDMNLKTIGAVGVDVQSVAFGGNSTCSSACTTGTCNLCNPVGTKITTITKSGSVGEYLVNGIDGTKYNCIVNAVGADFSPGAHYRASSTSSYAYIAFGNTAGSGQNGWGMVTCVGIP